VIQLIFFHKFFQRKFHSLNLFYTDNKFRTYNNVHSNICPKAPEVLFDSGSTYFHGIDDDQHRPLSARTSSMSMTRQLSNMSLNQSVRQ
jgi:hypothetical protein